MSPVKLLQSSWAAVVTLALCMWAQIPHSQSAFEYWSKGLSGWTFAWGFEAAVLMFVVRGMHWASWTFAAFSVLINVAYYSLDGVKMWAWPNADNWINWLLSIVLPFAIAMYSHVLAHGKDDEVERLHLPVWVQLWRMKIAQKVTEWRQGITKRRWSWAVAYLRYAQVVSSRRHNWRSGLAWVVSEDKAVQLVKDAQGVTLRQLRLLRREV